MPFPINFINLIYLAIQVFYDEENYEKLNSLFVQIGYMFFFIPNIILITIMNFLTIPIFYLFNFFKILKKDS